MGGLKKLIVFVPDIDYGAYVPKELLPTAWFVTHQYFSLWRLNGAVYFSATILRKLLGKKSKEIMIQFQAKKLFHLKTDYSAGLHSREYEFLPPFQKFCFKTIVEPELVAAYERNKTNRKSKVHRWLDEILGDALLTFDHESAMTELEKLSPAEFELLHKDCSMEEYQQILKYTFKQAENLRITWQNNRLELSSVDQFGFRYHHPIASLPKSFRKFIKWNETRLVNVDIKNSQPLFLCLAYAKKNALDGDWVKYKSLCESGNLYESLNQEKIDRESFKRQFFEEVLFAKGNSIAWSRFAQQFNREFPAVFSYIQRLKSPAPNRQLRGEDKERPHRLAAKVLQRAESDFVFKWVIPELKEMGIKPIITIHDSILTIKEHVETVQEVIVRQFSNRNFACELHVEPY